MKNLIGKKVLITTNSWFFAPDGLQYKAVHGTLLAIHTTEQTLGFTPNRANVNWYVQVGKITIAGCQVQYTLESDEVNSGTVIDSSGDRTEAYSGEQRRAEQFKRNSLIYVTQ